MRLSLFLAAAILLFALPSLDAIPASKAVVAGPSPGAGVPIAVLDHQLASKIISKEAYDEAIDSAKGGKVVSRAVLDQAIKNHPVGGASSGSAKSAQAVKTQPKPSSGPPPSSQAITSPPMSKSGGGGSQKSKVAPKFGSKPGAPSSAEESEIFKRKKLQIEEAEKAQLAKKQEADKGSKVVADPPVAKKDEVVKPPPPPSAKGGVKPPVSGGGAVSKGEVVSPPVIVDGHLAVLPANGGYDFEHDKDGAITKIYSYANGKHLDGFLSVETVFENPQSDNPVFRVTLKNAAGKFYAKAYIPTHSAVAYIFTTDAKVTPATIPQLYNVAISIPSKAVSVEAPNSKLPNYATWKVKGGAPFVIVKGNEVYQASQDKAFGGFGENQEGEKFFSATARGTNKVETLAAAFYPFFDKLHPQK